MNKEEKKYIILYAKLIFIGALCVYTFLAILFKYFPDTVEKSENSQQVSFAETDVSFIETSTDAIFIPDSEDWDVSSDMFSKDREYVQPIFFYIKNGYLYLEAINNETGFMQTSKIGRVQK